MKILYPKSISTRNKPRNLLSQDEEIFSHEFSKEIPATMLLHLRKVYLLQDTIFCPKALHFYLSYTHLRGLPVKSLLKRLFIFLTSKTEKIKKAIWITDEWSHGYFHWFTDALPRLIALELPEINPQNYVVVLPKRFANFPYIVQSLNILQYKVHFFERKVWAKELLLPSHTAPTGNYNKFIINKLREKFLANQSINHTVKSTLAEPKRIKGKS